MGPGSIAKSPSNIRSPAFCAGFFFAFFGPPPYTLCMLLVKKAAAPLALYFTFALAITFALLQWPDPTSPDGYFYFKNIQELSAFRGFYFHDYSLSFLLPSALNLLLRNVHLAWALGIGLSMASCPFSLAVIASAGREKRAHFLELVAFASLALVVQFPFVELGIGYYKNFFAMAVSLAALACFAHGLHGASHKRRWGILAAAMGFIALLCHKTMLFWLGMLFAVIFSPELYQIFRQRVSRRAFLLAGATASLVMVAIISIVYRKFAPQLIEALSFDSDPDPFRFWLTHSLEEEAAFAVATYLSWASWGFFLVRFLRSPREQWISFAAFTALIALVYHPFQLPGSNGLHYRLWMLLPTLPAYCLVSIAQAVPRYLRVALALLLLGAGIYEWSDVRDNLRADFVPYSAIRAEVKRIPEFVSPEDRLYCRHGLEFFVDFETPIRCRSFVDQNPRPNTWRVAFIKDIRNRGAIRLLKEASPLAIGAHYLLIKERTWQEVIAKFQIRPGNDNPSAVRPSFIHNQE